MEKRFDFNEEDFNDPKKFIKKFKELLKEMKEGFSEDRKKELDGFMKAMKGKEDLFEVRRIRRSTDLSGMGLFDSVINITEFMITNGIESFMSIPRRTNKRYDENIDEVYDYYLNSEQLEFNETFINNVNYLIDYYVEDEQYEKCVYLQWLQEQYAEHISQSN